MYSVGDVSSPYPFPTVLHVVLSFYLYKQMCFLNYGKPGLLEVYVSSIVLPTKWSQKKPSTLINTETSKQLTNVRSELTCQKRVDRLANNKIFSKLDK